MFRRLAPSALVASLVPALVLGLTGPTTAAPTAGSALPSKPTWSNDVTRAVADSAKIDRRYSKGVTQGDKMAFNLDIDNTSIATHYAYPQAVPQVLAIARRYRAKDVKLLFNTGRYSDQLGGIKQALTKAGYKYTIVCGRRHGMTIQAGKERCRDVFLGHGYVLLANFGNNPSDFTGTQNWSYSFHLPSYDGRLS